MVFLGCFGLSVFENMALAGMGLVYFSRRPALNSIQMYFLSIYCWGLSWWFVSLCACFTKYDKNVKHLSCSVFKKSHSRSTWNFLDLTEQRKSFVRTLILAFPLRSTEVIKSPMLWRLLLFFGGLISPLPLYLNQPSVLQSYYF
jgi:hypothetical protein